MKTFWVLLVVFSQFASAQASGSETLEEGRLTLAGITIGQSERAVIASLGAPQQRREEPDVFLPVTLSYSGLIISLDEQGVGGVLSTSERFCTSANVCPSMTYSQVTKIYGPSDAYERNGGIFRDYLWDDGCWLRIKFERDVAKSVEITCSP